VPRHGAMALLDVKKSKQDPRRQYDKRVNFAARRAVMGIVLQKARANPDNCLLAVMPDSPADHTERGHIGVGISGCPDTEINGILSDLGNLFDCMCKYVTRDRQRVTVLMPRDKVVTMVDRMTNQDRSSRERSPTPMPIPKVVPEATMAQSCTRPRVLG